MDSGQGSGAAAHVILHIGAGSFHRAHQAWYLHRLNEAKLEDEPHWSLTVGNIRSDMNAVLEALAAQDGVYTLETVTPQGERAYETIRSIERVVPWTESLDALIEAGLYFGAIKLGPFIQYASEDFKDPLRIDETRATGGLAYYIAGHNNNLKLSYTRIEPKHGDSRKQINLQWQVFQF